MLFPVFYFSIMLLNAAASTSGSRCSRNSINVGKTMSDLLGGYDRHMLPNSDGVNVTLEMHIQGITVISERTSDFELNIMYSEIWQDHRLSFQHLNLCTTNMTLKAEFREKIWTPDICIINSREAYVHWSPTENTFVMLYEDGLVWANFRIKVKAPCLMNLQLFPFDSQECSLVFESYSFNAHEVRLKWDKHPVTILSDIQLPDFRLTGWKSTVQKLPYPNGIWDSANVTFMFTRRYGFYLFQTYFPTALTVISSWVGFFFDIRSASARITLGVSSLLALTLQFGNVLRHLPRVSYIKCLDVWMITCVIFIFMTLIELAVICQLNRAESESLLEPPETPVFKQNSTPHRPKGTSVGGANNGPVMSRSTKMRRGGVQLDARDVRRRLEKTMGTDITDRLGGFGAAAASRKESTLTAIDEHPQTINDDDDSEDEMEAVVLRLNCSRTSPAFASVRSLSSSATGSSDDVPVASLEEDSLNALLSATETEKQPHGGHGGNAKIGCWRRLGDDRWCITAVQIDAVAKILFPMSYALFNVIYWAAYLGQME